ncbi:MAG: gliding motility-associated C-terminal domain-containing protein [Candidatus Margulisbacteria bacterium]|nr:gliding motility-associated C-terminal domain-containing protein [Candidatus Margulisiibacteriota bacterium]
MNTTIDSSGNAFGNLIVYLDFPSDALSTTQTASLAKTTNSYFSFSHAPNISYYPHLFSLTSTTEMTTPYQMTFTLPVSNGFILFDSEGTRKISTTLIGQLSIARWDDIGRWLTQTSTATIQSRSTGSSAIITASVNATGRFGVIDTSGVNADSKTSLKIINKIFKPSSTVNSFSSVTFTFPNPNNNFVELKIFDLSGHQIYKAQSSGGSSLSWSGNMLSGGLVNNGLYLYMIKLNNNNQTFSGYIMAAR